MSCLTQQEQPRIPDLLEQAADIRSFDVIKPMATFCNQP
jgi:hypothetical protein